MKVEDTETERGNRDERLEFAYAVMAEKSLGEILQAFERDMLPLVPLKGVFLRRVLYDDPTERIMSDIDLLVRSCDYERARNALEKLGFCEDRSEKILNHPRAYSHCHYYRDGSPLIELHQAVAPMAHEDEFERLLFGGRSTAYPADVFPYKCVHLPRPELQLIILALHFREHYLTVERHQIEDVARLCRRFEIDGRELQKFASKFKCEFALRLLLDASHDQKSLEISTALSTPLLRGLAHEYLFERNETGFVLKHSAALPRSLTLAMRALIHGVYSRDSLLESTLAHLKLLRFMLHRSRA